MKIVVLPAVAAWLLFAPGSGMADGIQPGLWRITTSVLNNGEPMPPRASLRCLTTAQAEDVADTFSPRFGGINTSCERAEPLAMDSHVTLEGEFVGVCQ